jgi:hypothetical protein
MQIKTVRVHSCNPTNEGVIENEKCRCRKFVRLDEAQALLDDGIARHIITSYKTVDTQENCPVCAGIENLKKSCSVCKGSGFITKPEILYTYGEDIFVRPFLRTPRTATCEAEHIEYAYIKGDKDAIKRIELYNILTQESLAELGATLINNQTGEVVVQGTIEPEDDFKKATGRRWDYGRSI